MYWIFMLILLEILTILTSAVSSNHHISLNSERNQFVPSSACLTLRKWMCAVGSSNLFDLSFPNFRHFLLLLSTLELWRSIVFALLCLQSFYRALLAVLRTYLCSCRKFVSEVVPCYVVFSLPMTGQVYMIPTLPVASLSTIVKDATE
jgi:hypothetical protein